MHTSIYTSIYNIISKHKNHRWRMTVWLGKTFPGFIKLNPLSQYRKFSTYGASEKKSDFSKNTWVIWNIFQIAQLTSWTLLEHVTKYEYFFKSFWLKFMLLKFLSDWQNLKSLGENCPFLSLFPILLSPKKELH